MEWQPIETAPRDGTRILVYRTAENGYASKLCGVDMMISGKWWYSRRDMQPTHWVPLPEPPEQTPTKP